MVTVEVPSCRTVPLDPVFTPTTNWRVVGGTVMDVHVPVEPFAPTPTEKLPATGEAEDGVVVQRDRPVRPVALVSPPIRMSASVCRNCALSERVRMPVL